MRMEHTLFGGDLRKMSDMLSPLSRRKYNETNFPLLQEGQPDPLDEFLQYMILISDTLLRSKMAWEEISSADLRHTAASNILRSVEDVGYIYLDLLEGNCTEQQNKTVMPNQNLNVQLVKMPKHLITNDTCYTFKYDTICFPLSAFHHVTDTCIINVATFINFENYELGPFPTFFINPSTKNSSIASLSINQGLERLNISIPGNEDPVQITFQHLETKVNPISILFYQYHRIWIS
jgi:hypothetical protein